MKVSGSKWRVNQRRFLRGKGKRWHKTRIPGTIRLTRLPGGSGFRNKWQAAEMDHG